MTFSQLLLNFQKDYGLDHNVIFFEILFYLSSKVKNKETFVSLKNEEIDFSERKFTKLCKKYFVKQCPLAHITKQAKFCNLSFVINKKVLSPRDITEQMVIDFISKHKNDQAAKLIDLCCGSGCIGITIKKNIPQFNVTCVDKYWAPVYNTGINCMKQKTAILVEQKDAIKYLNSLHTVDYLISNPPYINKDNFKNKKMYKWENKKALVGPENGLYFYKHFFLWLSKHNFKEAWFEVGYDLFDKLKIELAKYSNLNYSLENKKNYLVVFPK